MTHPIDIRESVAMSTRIYVHPNCYLHDLQINDGTSVPSVQISLCDSVCLALEPPMPVCVRFFPLLSSYWLHCNPPLISVLLICLGILRLLQVFYNISIKYHFKLLTTHTHTLFTLTYAWYLHNCLFPIIATHFQSVPCHLSNLIWCIGSCLTSQSIRLAPCFTFPLSFTHHINVAKLVELHLLKAPL